MAKTRTVYTTSYSGKNKHSLYPAHIIDIISEQAADLLNFYEMQKKYADILQPNGNIQYWISWTDTDLFKKDYTNTGRKRYKSAGVP